MQSTTDMLRLSSRTSVVGTCHIDWRQALAVKGEASCIVQLAGPERETVGHISVDLEVRPIFSNVHSALSCLSCTQPRGALLASCSLISLEISGLCTQSSFSVSFSSAVFHISIISPTERAQTKKWSCDLSNASQARHFCMVEHALQGLRMGQFAAVSPAMQHRVTSMDDG